MQRVGKLLVAAIVLPRSLSLPNVISMKVMRVDENCIPKFGQGDYESTAV